MAIIDKFTREELAAIVARSTSMKEVINQLGYSTTSGSNNITVKSRLEKYGIDYSHFSYQQNPSIERNEENIFIQDSTASQSTLRRWYKKSEYTPYICSICGQEPIWQGKELTLILDHVNGKNHDDRLENLRWVCPNCNQQLETTGYSKQRAALQKRNEKKQNCCMDCGTAITVYATRCIECSRQQKIKDSNIPSREALKHMIRIKPFTIIGKELNVSDNAVRKWCDKYNLPRKKTEIMNYSDEEWELI